MSSANEAYQHAQAAHDKIEGHEDLCALRYANIHTELTGVKNTVGTVLKLLAWGGSTVFVMLLSVLGWLTVRAINSNDDQVSHLQNQIERMQQPQPVKAVFRKVSPLS